ncbi:MAG: bifunctional histidinol-phosphatase/imidazoleglycerol-phosphate dehydratase HisB [Saprospiraceae bacterium]
MKKVLFIDRDGVLIKEPPETYQVDNLEQMEFLPGVIRNLRKIVTEMDYELVMITNQDGLGTAAYPQENFDSVQNKMLQIFENEGVVFDAIFVDKTFEHEKQPTRKPGTALLAQYLKGGYDLANSYVIGDRWSDMQLALNLGAKGIGITGLFPLGDYEKHAEIYAENWDEIYEYLKPKRIAKVVRNTKETKIKIELNLDGKGMAKINTGLGFFDHMLEQIARHGELDLLIQVNGDLHIDEHHTIEDTGLALGEAFLIAIGNKKGIERYGYCLPMDDCLVQVAIDFGGRPWIVWAAEFKREKIGGMPTEMFFHFFKSLSDTAKVNLNIKAEGENEHHKVEAIFKAFARAVKMAKIKTGDQLPSTKGVL